jgi:hypothetical protein
LFPPPPFFHDCRVLCGGFTPNEYDLEEGEELLVSYALLDAPITRPNVDWVPEVGLPSNMPPAQAPPDVCPQARTC